MQVLNRAHAQLLHLRKVAWVVVHLHLSPPFEGVCCFQRNIAMPKEMCLVRSPNWLGLFQNNSCSNHQGAWELPFVINSAP